MGVILDCVLDQENEEVSLILGNQLKWRVRGILLIIYYHTVKGKKLHSCVKGRACSFSINDISE